MKVGSDFTQLFASPFVGQTGNFDVIVHVLWVVLIYKNDILIASRRIKILLSVTYLWVRIPELTFMFFTVL